MSPGDVRVRGGGLAGLSAAIELARSGRPVTVFERRSRIGAHRPGDIEFLENWTESRDALDWLSEMQLGVNFSAAPIHRLTIVGPGLKELVNIESHRPIMYQVQRGPMPGSIDQGLYLQALEAGVRFRLRTSLSEADADIVASGPAVVGGLGLGYIFETDLADGVYCILDNDLAPRGYGWLCVKEGQGTVAIGITSDFARLCRCLNQLLASLQALLDFQVRRPRRFGVYVNVSFAFPSAVQGGRLYVGEAAGFQDALLGFGMRYAIRSGYLAARSITHESDYDCLWKAEFLPHLIAGSVNRMATELFGTNAGIHILLRRLRGHKADVVTYLRSNYALTWQKRLAHGVYAMAPRVFGAIIFGAARHRRQVLDLHSRAVCPAG